MARNETARAWSAELIRQLADHANQRGKTIYNLNRMATVGAGQVDTVARIAATVGYQLAIQPPEERGSGKWYAMGGNWRELLKTMIFHWWNREDEELIATGLETDTIDRVSNIRKQLKEAGLNARCFTDWLQNNKTPTMENFCILGMFEGFQIEWREVKE